MFNEKYTRRKNEKVEHVFLSTKDKRRQIMSEFKLLKFCALVSFIS